MSEIKSSEISVVVQGAVDKELTPKCLASIRKYLPKAEIILSTWEGTDISGLDYDKVILNKDPGNFTQYGNKYVPNNVNRQIVSTTSGLCLASKKYALKMRTDFYLKNANFLKYFDKYKLFDTKYKLFQKRLLINMAITYNPKFKRYMKETNCICQFPFHISDFVTFGLVEDVKKLWDIPCVPTYDQKFFLDQKNSGLQQTPNICRYHAEQHIWISCLRKSGYKIDCNFQTDTNPEIEELSDRFLVNNFYILSFRKYGNVPIKDYLKRKNNIYFDNMFYTEYAWKKLYVKYFNLKKKMIFDMDRMIIIKKNYSLFIWFIF